MNKRHTTQGSALMMALMIIGAVGAITALSVVVARNESLGSQSMAQETLQRTATTGDNQLPMGALQMALPRIMEQAFEQSSVMAYMPATRTGPSNSTDYYASLWNEQLYPVGAVDQALFQAKLDAAFCKMDGISSFRVYVTPLACGVPLPAGYSLPPIEPAQGGAVATWEVPIIATWKRGDIPFLTSGSIEITAGNAGTGFYTYNANDLSLLPAMNTTGRVRGTQLLRLYSGTYAKSASTTGCTIPGCSQPTLRLGNSATSAKTYAVTSLKPTVSRPCYPDACPVIPEGLNGNGPMLTPTEQSLDGFAFGYKTNPYVIDPPMVIDVTASNARIETWYGPWNSIYTNRPVAANATTILSTYKPPPNPMPETVNSSGELIAQYQLSNPRTMTQFIRICTGTTGTYSGCNTYYSWEERNQPALVRVNGSATVSSLMETKPRVSGGPLLSAGYPSLGLNRRMTIQTSGELRVNSSMNYPFNVCYGQTKIALSGSTANISPAYCAQDEAKGVSVMQGTLLGLRSTGGNIALSSNAQRQPIVLHASLLADRGQITALQSNLYEVKITGNVAASTIAPSPTTLTRVETDPRLANGRFSAPGFPFYEKQVLHLETNFAPPVRTDQLRNTTLGGLGGNGQP